MPLFELEASPRGRMRVFARAQLPLLLATGFICLVVAVAVPAALTSAVFSERPDVGRGRRHRGRRPHQG
jgi:hypothetical protein